MILILLASKSLAEGTRKKYFEGNQIISTLLVSMIKISRRLDYPKSHIIIVGLLIYASFLGVATISPGEASSKKIEIGQK